MKKVKFTHPILGEKEFNYQHGKKLWELEKVSPSGWKLEEDQDLDFLKLDESINKEDAANITADSRNIEKTDKEQKRSSKSGKSRSKGKIT